MLFVDYYGPEDVYDRAHASLQTQVGRVFRLPAELVAVRRFPVQGGRDEVELWVEVSSDEQVYRFGNRLAAELTRAVREHTNVDVWVMYRIVPLANAFLNGEPRARAVEAFE
jgi:hypothetical protein